MKILKEFKEFAARGNMVDMAVGIVIGAAFGKVISSLVADVIMPPIGLLLGSVNFSDLAVVLKSGDPAPVTLNYGKFLQNIADFIIVAIAMFVLLKAVNAHKRREEKPPATPREVVLLEEIRDLLKRT